MTYLQLCVHLPAIQFCALAQCLRGLPLIHPPGTRPPRENTCGLSKMHTNITHVRRIV
jgi:hypothetical protein